MRPRRQTLALLVTALLAVSAVPAVAGPAENAFLQRLTANWVGKGRLQGAQSGPVACRIVVSSGGQSAKYQGRCNIPDMASQAFNGAIFYNDKAKRYEARSVGGTVPGIKRGNTLVFTTKSSTMAGTSYSTMTISPTSLVVDFTLLDRDKQKTTSRITFSK